jgi:hypothetical protein
MEASTGWIWKNLLFTGEILPKIKVKKKKKKKNILGGYHNQK